MSNTVLQPEKPIEGVGLLSDLSIQNHPIEGFLDYAEHAVQPTELILVPGSHHQRTIKQRFAQADKPTDTVVFSSIEDIATDLQVEEGIEPTSRLDRADRLALLERIVETDETLCAQLALSLGVTPAVAIETVERARAAVESMTGYHPERIGAIREWCRRREGPTADDCLNLVDGVVGLERELRQQTAHATSSEMQLRRAIRLLSQRGSQLWMDAYPSIERLWVCGLTAPPASLCDFLGVAAAVTDAQVHLDARPVSGELIWSRIDTVCDISDPGTEVI